MNDPFMIGLARFMSIFFALSAVAVYVYSRCTPFGAENIWLTNMARPFGAELRGRLAAALARRGNERTEPWTGGVVLVLQLALCACCYFGMLSLAATFAAYFALILAQQCVAFMVTHKSRIGPRVASLQPRMIARIVPPWSLWLPGYRLVREPRRRVADGSMACHSSEHCDVGRGACVGLCDDVMAGDYRRSRHTSR